MQENGIGKAAVRITKVECVCQKTFTTRSASFETPNKTLQHCDGNRMPVCQRMPFDKAKKVEVLGESYRKSWAQSRLESTKTSEQRRLSLPECGEDLRDLR